MLEIKRSSVGLRGCEPMFTIPWVGNDGWKALHGRLGESLLLPTMTFCLYFQSSSYVNSLNTACREALERKHFPSESKSTLRHLFDRLPISAVVKGMWLICVLCVCCWSVALRCLFSSPELGLAVFCMIQSECSQLQGKYINLQTQVLQTLSIMSLQDRRKNPIYRYMI